MPDVREILLSTIEEKRPLVLLLGEDAWSESPHGDVLLASSLQRLDCVGSENTGWSGMLTVDPLPPGHYSWLAERFERRIHPEFVEVLRELPWSAIFTSSVDPTLLRLFSYRGREPEPVLTEEERPRAARSTARPPFYYLFSRAGEQDVRAEPPNSRRELNTRRAQHAVPLLNRIRETATPLGTIVIDGLLRGNGWLRIQDLLGALERASVRQILWFGGTPDLPLEDAEYFAEFQHEGQILVEDKRLGTVIAELAASGWLGDIGQLESEDVGRVSFASGGAYEVPPDVRLRVEAVASIVDDSWTSFIPPLGPDSKYDAFRRFHGALGGPRLLVEGVRRGFAIERDFEQQLSSQVLAALADHSKLEVPIVIEGQSGVGKSVALSRLVTKVREAKAAAVLYAIGRVPQSQEVSGFCQAVERSDAPVTLIVCDANRTIDDYDELLSGLRSLGRRIVVVGSQYRASSNDGTNQQSRTEVPAALSDSERQKLLDLIGGFDVARQVQPDDDHFLAFLYRYLPASRPHIGSGLGAEARATVQVLDERGSQQQMTPIISQLHQQLIDKGYISDYQAILDDQQSRELDANDRSAGKIIDMVMVAGRLNCPVPVNLLLRAVSQHQRFDAALVSNLFADLDLFRWITRDSESNELLVTPRLPLEARLICERRLGSTQAEADVLVDLIGSVRLGLDGTHERAFLLELLQQIGRDGPRGSVYRHSYADFARKLTELRSHYNVVDASLMLQESAFRRSAVREEQTSDSLRFSLLEEARDAVQTALDEIDSGRLRAARRTKQNLLVERAALYGFLAYDHVHRNESASDVWSAYQAAKVAVRQAVSTADNYYPYDVGLWTPADLFRSANLPESRRAELAADIYSTLDQVELDSLPPSQREKFEARRMSVGATLGNHVLTDAAYGDLESLNSTAGYFLRAREYAPDVSTHDIEVTADDDIKRAERAANFLTDRFDRIQQDERCLWLLLENRWIAEMRRRPLRGERQPLPTGDVQWQLLSIVRPLNLAAGDSARYGTRYLEAVLTWLTSDYIEAREIFRQLDRETDNVYRGRVFRRHVITDNSGSPKSFSGRIEDATGQDRWRLRVGELGQTIDLLARDFPREDIQYGRTLSSFSIAFNFIGPIADPIRR